MPKQKKFFLGLQNYLLFNRYLEGDYGKMRSTQEFLLLSYGIFDWLSLDLKGGAGWIKEQPSGSDELYYSTYVGGGYGFRLRAFEKDKIKAVFGFQHISIHPQTTSSNGAKNKSVLDDWQLSLLGSYDFGFFVPYLGTRWSRCDYIHWQNGSRNRKKSAAGKSVGLVAGCDIPLGERLWVNLEGQAFDAQAFAFSLNYQF